jgi:glycosyltransferase involved in cell wall biosynthesis
VYLSQILKHISPSSLARWELFGWDYDRFAFAEAAPDIDFISRCRINGNTANALWHIARFKGFARQRHYDVCFFPAAHRRVPRKCPCASIGTVHDMAAFWGPHNTREHLGVVLRPLYPKAIRRLDHILAVSNFVKQELVQILKVPEAKIEVVHNGIDHKAFHPRPKNNEDTLLIQPFAFRRPYILYVSRLDHPIKNHLRLIQAFDIFKNDTKYPHRLVLAGGNSHGSEQVREAARASAYAQDIFFTGHFPPESLPELYAGADFAVFPGIYEGFGQGVLEAMACGVPVACARAGSLPEVAEHAAVYFDPFQAGDIAERMKSLANDKNLVRDCREKGLERATHFSWDRCASRTLDLLQSAAVK